jgi:GT2 family glycosyltransferase
MANLQNRNKITSNRSKLVTVIIPTFNRKNDLYRCLKSITKQDVYSSNSNLIEIIVIDNASDDSTSEMLKEEFPNIEVIRNTVNLGPSYARNQAIKKANKYIWFLDSDSIVENSSCLDTMINMMESDQSIGSIGGELYKTHNQDFIKIKHILINGDTFTEFKKAADTINIECDCLATCNCFARRSILYEIGGFDPAYFIFSEDKEIGYKINKLGYKNICDYRTSVFHDISLEFKRNTFQKYRNTLRFVIKNFPFWKILILPVSMIIVNIYLYHSFISRVNLKDPAILKHVDSNKFHPKVLTLFISRCFAAQTAAFIWNIINLYSTLKVRYKSINYIDNAK